MLIININAQIIFFILQILIGIRIVFHISYQCAMMSEIALNITLHVTNVIDYYDILFHNDAYNEHQCTNHFRCIAD